MSRLWSKFLADCSGVTALETGLVAPVLLVMSLGGYQVSQMVARQHELQSAASEAVDIALASNPDTSSKRDTLKGVLMTTTGLPASAVSLEMRYRCGVDPIQTSDTCSEPEEMTKYLRIRLTDTYDPMWKAFGIGEQIQYDVVRTVIIT